MEVYIMPLKQTLAGRTATWPHCGEYALDITHKSFVTKRPVTGWIPTRSENIPTHVQKLVVLWFQAPGGRLCHIAV